MAEEFDSLGSIGAISAADGTLLRDSTTAPRRTAPAGSSLPTRKPETPAQNAGSTARPPPQNPPTLEEAVDQLNEQLAGAGRSVQLSFDPVTGEPIATISNSETGQIVQRIPGEDLIRLALMLKGWSEGNTVLVDLLA